MSAPADVMLVTVNKHETQAVVQSFREATGAEARTISINDRFYRDLGTINGTKVFHALSEMGTAGPGATLQTVDKGIQALNPGAVICVGIAFGVNEKKQAIGDILISTQLRLYDLQRRGEQIILRGDKPHASTRLINFFGGVAQTSWKGARVRPGLILSGDKLVDDIDYRDQLLQFEPEAVGGEMEGAGVYVASHDYKVDWIVIKAICDWGDGKKSKNKTARQKKAAQNAAAFLIYALQQAPLKSPHPRRQKLRSVLIQVTDRLGHPIIGADIELYVHDERQLTTRKNTSKPIRLKFPFDVPASVVARVSGHEAQRVNIGASATECNFRFD